MLRRRPSVIRCQTPNDNGINRCLTPNDTRRIALVAALLLVAANCSSGSDGVGSPASTSSTPTAVTGEAPSASSPSTDASTASDPIDSAPATNSGDFTSRVSGLPPATGEPMLIGLVNTEGLPGLDLVDIRVDIEATFAYLNEHGGFGGRPLELTSCASKASPESSQACAQEITGSGVELALLGLDVFPGYATFAASNVPVIGLLPILPADYSADALFMTGGNATLAAGMAGVAKERFDAKTVGIISADDPGTNGTESALTASLDKLGIEYVSIKGGTEETDAGLQGLLAQANADNPDLLVSLYGDAGCIGAMRGRTALGISTPVLTSSSCAASDVIEEVGDEALGWVFLGAQTNDPSPSNDLIAEIMAPVLGIPVDEVDPSSLGLGGLGIIQAMTLAQYADAIVADGGEVTGASLYEYFGSTATSIWPGLPAQCGRAAAYPSVCTFEFPVIEYLADGTLQPADGVESVSAFEYLP
jgi:branched-chain amino acid transport system substrate-binding protein